MNLVSGISLDLHAGETLALVGESGCGKSITALALMGLLPPACRVTAESYTFGGVHYPRELPDELRGNRLAMIFQDPNTAFNPAFTIGDQLEEVWLRHKPGGRTVARARALNLLERVGIASPAQRLKQYPHQLSGGLRQRAMIAMALMCGPELLVADEPTTALDVTVQAQVLRLLKELQQELGLGMILISHDIGIVAAMADKIAIMYAGEIVETGPASEVLANPCHPYTLGLMECIPGVSRRQRRLKTIPGAVLAPEERGIGIGCRFANRCPFVIDRCRGEQVQLVSERARSVRCVRSAEVEKRRRTSGTGCVGALQGEAGDGGEPILEARMLIRNFMSTRGLFSRAAQLKALRGVSLRILRNQTVAIVGESGCGKSTLARIALGLLPSTSGEVRISGQAVEELGRKQLARLVQPVFQDPYASLAPHRTVFDAVMVPLRVLKVGTAAERRRRVLGMLEKVGLPDRMAYRLPAELSGGQRQRVAIARALVLRPPLLICDEPTSALDVSVQAQILNLLTDLKDELSLSILLITHNIAVVRQIADQVIVMYLGQVVEEGPVDEVLERPKHPYTQLLLSSMLELGGEASVMSSQVMDGQFPDPFNPPSGCAFHPRCPRRSEVCTELSPPLTPTNSGMVACHHPLTRDRQQTTPKSEQEWSLTN